MSIAQQSDGAQTQTHSFETMPEAVDSPSSKLVYLYLHTAGDAHIDELQATLDMKKLALYPVLNTLETHDLVDRDGETFTLAS